VVVESQREIAGKITRETRVYIAYNLMRKAPGKDSIRLRRKTTGWDDDYLAS
jgi:hypothetical protein